MHEEHKQLTVPVLIHKYPGASPSKLNLDAGVLAKG